MGSGQGRFAWWREKRYSVSDLQRAFAEGRRATDKAGQLVPHRDSWVDGFRQGMIVAGVRPPWTRGETEAEYDRLWPDPTADPFMAPELRPPAPPSKDVPPPFHDQG